MSAARPLRRSRGPHPPRGDSAQREGGNRSAGLDSIRGCFEGGVPSLLASCASDGVPNLTYVSQVHYVDREHVALSFQFFNKTYENVRANPQAMAYVADPDTGASYRLSLQYLRTEESGPLFESMKAKLAGTIPIAVPIR